MHRITVVENFITPEDAAILIDEQHNPSEVNPYPSYYKDRYGGTSLPYNKILIYQTIRYRLPPCKIIDLSKLRLRFWVII